MDTNGIVGLAEDCYCRRASVGVEGEVLAYFFDQEDMDEFLRQAAELGLNVRDTGRLWAEVSPV